MFQNKEEIYSSSRESPRDSTVSRVAREARGETVPGRTGQLLFRVYMPSSSSRNDTCRYDNTWKLRLVLPHT